MAKIIKRNNSLIETMNEQGSPIAPTTPLSAAILGNANPDQAKMMGTPNAKRANIDRAMTYQGQQQAKATQESTTIKEQDERTKALLDKAAKGTFLLPGLRQMSQSVLEKALTARGKTFDVTINQSAISALRLNEADSLKLNKALTVLLGEVDPNKRAKAMSDINSVVPGEVNAASLQGFYNGNVEDVVDFITGDVLDLVTVGEFVEGMSSGELRAKYGFESLAELEEFFGTDVSEISVTDLDEMAKSMRSSYDSSGDLLKRVSDPNVGPEERQLAMQRLRELGLGGYMFAEEKINDITKQIEDNDKIVFDGKEMTIEQVLEDDFLSGTIADALSDPTGKRIKELSKSNPVFGKWLTDNKEILTKFAQNIEKTTIDYSKKVQEIKDMTKITPELDVPDNIMKALVPGWDPTSGVSPTKTTPLYEAMKKKAKDDPTKSLPEIITQLTTVSAERLSELTKLTEDQLNKMNLFTDPTGFFTKLNEHETAVTELDVLKNQLGASKTPQQKSKFMTDYVNSVFPDAKAAQAMFDNILSANNNITPKELRYLDKDNDGEIDLLDPDQQEKIITTLFSGKKSLAEVIQGGPTTADGIRNQLSDLMRNGNSKIASIKANDELKQILPGMRIKDLPKQLTGVVTDINPKRVAQLGNIVDYLETQMKIIGTLPRDEQETLSKVYREHKAKFPAYKALANVSAGLAEKEVYKRHDDAIQLKATYKPILENLEVLKNSTDPNLKKQYQSAKASLFKQVNQLAKIFVEPSRKGLIDKSFQDKVPLSAYVDSWQTSDNAKVAYAEVFVPIMKALGYK